MAKAKAKFYFWEWDKNPELIGTLVGKMPKFPPWGRYVFVFDTEKGARVYTWGYLRLLKEVVHAPFGTKFKIVCEGKMPHPDTGHQTYMFNVEVLEIGQIKPKKEKAEKKPKKK